MDPGVALRELGEEVRRRDGAVAPDEPGLECASFTRFLLLNREMGLGQAGRMVQRLLEIETYRMMALLALPMARKVQGELASLRQKLRLSQDQLSRTVLVAHRAAVTAKPTVARKKTTAMWWMQSTPR